MKRVLASELEEKMADINSRRMIVEGQFEKLEAKIKATSLLLTEWLNNTRNPRTSRRKWSRAA